MTHFLSLHSDEIFLADENQKTFTVIKDFFFAVLNIDGGLLVISNKKTRCFENVKPSRAKSLSCRDLRLLLYPTQIMILKRSCLINVRHVKTSNQDICFHFTTICLKHNINFDSWSGQDIILCQFHERLISILVPPKDSDRFCSVLECENTEKFSDFNIEIDFQKNDNICSLPQQNVHSLNFFAL